MKKFSDVQSIHKLMSRRDEMEGEFSDEYSKAFKVGDEVSCNRCGREHVGVIAGILLQGSDTVLRVNAPMIRSPYFDIRASEIVSSLYRKDLGMKKGPR